MAKVFRGHGLDYDVDGLTEFLVEAAKKVGIEGTAEFLDDPNKGVQEVLLNLRSTRPPHNSVPYYVTTFFRTDQWKKQARLANPRGLCKSFSGS
ncbi:hypothetical protein IFM89_021414 [Coptis chinensis]|uniref:Uncharacterized protein n=1 Tax=Coptis chinensis TaxID=261450 RepID=A0A835I420_9MAGN|nr:hypothetical protein IFM89_021414 [Coptis chinensis]